MSARQSTSKDQVRFFWDNYLKRIHKKGVKPPFDRWFVKRAEDYIATSNGKRLGEHLAEDLESYLREIGRKRGIKDWQFRQIVDALQNLFEQVGVSWHSDFDWEHWKDSARSLGRAHPTVARSYDDIDDSTQQNASSEANKYRFEETPRSHQKLLETLRIQTGIRAER